MRRGVKWGLAGLALLILLLAVPLGFVLWRMGADHPIVWKHCVGRGRAFYSALGHTPSAYQEPLHLRMLEGAIAWAAGQAGEGCSGSSP
jgi:type 1 glutamine amidotransferase